MDATNGIGWVECHHCGGGGCGDCFDEGGTEFGSATEESLAWDACRRFTGYQRREWIEPGHPKPALGHFVWRQATPPILEMLRRTYQPEWVPGVRCRRSVRGLCVWRGSTVEGEALAVAVTGVGQFDYTPDYIGPYARRLFGDDWFIGGLDL